MLKQFNPEVQARQRELDAAELRLHVDEELSFAELGDRLAVNEETARRRVRRAEQRALKELAHQVAAAKQKHTLRLERLLRRGWKDYDKDPSPKRYECILKTLEQLRKVWGLGEQNAPDAPTAPTVFAQQASITQLDPATVRALLGRDPIPIPGRAPITMESPLLIENDAPAESPEGDAPGNGRAT
jgi:hypothetical protein